MPPCWICRENEANSGEHKTKRSDLLAVLGRPTQDDPFFYHDLHQPNRPVKSLDAKILKSPVRICAYCNNTRTQPHDRAWERMSDWLRNRQPSLAVGEAVRCNRIFPFSTRAEMTKVHLFFVKLFGCMLAESDSLGKNLPIDLTGFSTAIMSSRPHAEVYLQFGVCDGTIGRTNLHCWTANHDGSVIAAWMYELNTIAVRIIFVQSGRFDPPKNGWTPHSKRILVDDFRHKRRAAAEERARIEAGA